MNNRELKNLKSELKDQSEVLETVQKQNKELELKIENMK
jgi:hypothetical protein